jgi:hypothetical protein
MRPFLSILGLLLAAPFALLACGNSGSELSPPDGGDAGVEAAVHDATKDSPADMTAEREAAADGPFTMAPHAPFPQIPYQDGGVILAPQLVTVTFPSDPYTSQLVAFGDGVESSSWWTTVIKGYCEGPSGACIGAGATATSVVYPTAPASSYTDSVEGGPSTLQTWLASALASGDLPPPSAGDISNTLYLLYFPASTTITLDGTGGCENYDGYHAAMVYGGQQVPYAVISECPGAGMGVPPITTLQGTTITAAHEILEAATDPSDLTTGYYLNLYDPSTYGWNDVEGGEVADVCVDVFGFDQDEWAEGDFTVQRIWSNAQAAAGGDPCAPLTMESVYFNAAPKQSFFVLDVGSSLTFEIDAFSVAPRDDWTLTVQDWSLYPTNPYLSFSIVGGTVDKNLGDIIQVNNGSKVQVKMTLESDPGDNPNGEADGAILSFTGKFQGAPASFWPFAVMSPADAEDAGVDAAVSGGGKRPRRKRVTYPHRATSAELIPGLARFLRHRGL